MFAVMVKHSRSNTAEPVEYRRCGSQSSANAIARSLMEEKFIDRHDRKCQGKMVPRYSLVFVRETVDKVTD